MPNQKSENTEMKYPTNPLAVFESGIQTDVRFTIAFDILKSGAINLNGTIGSCAEAALELADALIAGAEKRGWVRPLSESADLPAAVRVQIERNANAQVYSQEAGQKAAQAARAAQGSIIPVRPIPGGVVEH
jgi:hypothetical protein